MEQREKELALRMEQFKKQLDEDKKHFETEEKKKLWSIAQQEAQKKIEEKNASLIAALKQDLEAKQKEIVANRQKELELLKKEQELKHQQELMKIQLQKELMEKTSLIEEAAKKRKTKNLNW